MANSCWKSVTKSMAVSRSPREPARWGRVAKRRDVEMALVASGMDLQTHAA